MAINKSLSFTIHHDDLNEFRMFIVRLGFKRFYERDAFAKLNPAKHAQYYRRFMYRYAYRDCILMFESSTNMPICIITFNSGQEKACDIVRDCWRSGIGKVRGKARYEAMKLRRQEEMVFENWVTEEGA
jgi:hypothetical protein